jgi:hypothetical protein
MAREAGIEVGKVFVEGMLTDAATMELKAFEALVRADERESFIAEMQAQIDHAVINDLCLPPNFGKQKGDLAVRVSSIEAALDAIRNRRNT